MSSLRSGLVKDAQARVAAPTVVRAPTHALQRRSDLEPQPQLAPDTAEQEGDEAEELGRNGVERRGVPCAQWQDTRNHFRAMPHSCQQPLPASGPREKAWSSAGAASPAAWDWRLCLPPPSERHEPHRQPQHQSYERRGALLQPRVKSTW